MQQGKKINRKRYFFIFFLTLIIFGSGFFLSNFLFEKKIGPLKNFQQDLLIDLLSLETQFSILTQAPCQNLDEPALTEQLKNISQRLTLTAGRLGEKNPEFLQFKKYYSILEIKYWLLLKKLNKECNLNLVLIIYFYDDEKKCSDCQDQGYVLGYLGEKYPFLRIYSFDYNLALSAVQTLRSIYSLKGDLPAIVANNQVYYGFKDKSALEEILNLKSTATTTPITTTTKEKKQEKK